jgi:flagellar biosynthesis GTPase FlhF
MNTGYQQLIKKIDDFIRKYYLNKLVRGAIWLSGIFLLSYIFLIVSEYYSYFSINTKTILFYSFIFTQLILAWFLTGKHLVAYLHLGKIINHEQASEIIGAHFPDVKDKLINTLQLKKQSDLGNQNNALLEASINQRIASLKPIPFVKAVRISENKKYLQYALFPMAIVIVIAFAAPTILTDGTERLINHNVFYKKKAPFDFDVTNKSLKVTQGDDFELKVKLSGDQIPQDIYLEDGVNTFKLNKSDIINFNYLFKNLQSNKTFRLKAGEFYSDEYTINVKSKPVLISYSALFTYPAYINKQAEVVQNPGDITVPVGTNVTWSFKTEHVNQLGFSYQNQRKNITTENKDNFIFKNRIIKNGGYSIFLENKEVSTQDSLSYQINTIADLYPKIEVNQRLDSANLNVVYFIGKVADDYGLSSLNFHYQILKTDDESKKGKKFSVAVKFDKPAAQSSFFYLWKLKEIGLKPGEEIAYYFDVADNDGVFGAKHTQSATLTYKLASKEESIEKIEETSQAIKQKMQSAIRQTDKIQKDTKKLNQELIDQKTIGYEQKKQIENLVEQQKKLENLIKDIQKDGKQNLLDRKEIQPNNEKILEKQKQIQDLFDNVLDEKTKKLLENLQKMMEQNQKELTKDQLQQMQVDNKALEKELDRILELYKKLEVEQKLNDAIEKLDELAQKQEELSKQNDKDNLQKQKDLEKAFDDLKKDLKEVDKKNQELDKPADFENPEQDQKDIDQEMDNAEKSLEENKSQKASQSQKNAAQKMKQLSQKLQSMQQNGEEQENKVNEQELRQILKNLLQSSFDQEKVMVDLKRTNQDDPSFIKLAQKQRDIKDNLKMVEDSLYSLSKKVPQIESTVNKEIQAINQQIEQSLEFLTERRVDQANRNQQFALTSINNLALMLSEALKQLQDAMKNAQSGGKGKPKPGLSQLSEMQKELNKNMQKAKEQMEQQGIKPGQKGKSGMSEQMAKMAQQQQMIRQALQEISNNLNKDGQGKLGNLEKIMKEMEQTELDLVNKRITQEALIRQQEIQTRLLEAEKAEREREQDTKRESKAAKNFTPNYNLILEEYQKQRAKEVEQIKTMPPTLNYFYKSKISEYFKKLNLVD